MNSKIDNIWKVILTVSGMYAFNKYWLLLLILQVAIKIPILQINNLRLGEVK